ncbi:TetR/AcrR family transcriptional regulator C-terminal domain-containing protein [Sphaerisporangium dianthi]|uniref:TetR/AcrR family transcriptional regulator C-terminal domain-containing protein n=1 Tax=Sphaerisporangium dianthi TaxID=1436120 RepID=A0ABV9CAI9_9ACTN
MPPKQRFISVWSRQSAQRPAPVREQPALSREQIVKASIELLDAEGLDALSMRKLGSRLGSGATSIYWHVSNKDQLLELALDEIYAEVRLPDAATAGWHDTGAAFAYGMRHAVLQHPWSVTLIGSMPSIGPNALNAVSTLSTAFELGGFTGVTLDFAVSSIVSYTLGATTPEAIWVNTVGRAGADQAEWVADMSAQLHVAGAEHPELLARYDSLHDLDITQMRRLSFDYGLSALLDGLALRLRQT